VRALGLIAAAIPCVATQAARADDTEPAWRASALAMVPAGYVAGTAYRTTDGGPKRILACRGLWGLVESQDGVRGRWPALCSNQVTNCS
jgi:hypothetical protein